MVFSLFRKGRGGRAEPAQQPSSMPPKRAEPPAPADAVARPAARSPDASAGETNLAEPAPAATATGSSLPSTGAAPVAPPPAAARMPEPGAQAAVAASPVPPPADLLESHGGPRSDAGLEVGNFGLEVGSSGVSPVIEEAAILYANDQVEAAVDVLTQAIRDDQLGGATLQAWLMLLDLYQFLGWKDQFEALALDYAARFESSPPTWHDEEVVRPPVADQGASARAGIVLPAVIDAAVSRQVDAIDRAAQRDRGVTIDCRGVRAVEPAGAGLLDAALGRLERGTRQAAFIAPERLLDAARAAVQTGRRDFDAGGWLLLLRLLRLAGAQSEFDDASIDYCITYEVSPPPWEPMPAHMQREDAAAPPAGGSAPAPAGNAPGSTAPGSTAPGSTAPGGAAPGGGSHRPALRADAFVLAGDIAGAMQAETAALRAHAERHAHVFIDCRALRRLDFAAAGQLLNLVAGLRAAGRTVEFDQPSHAVAALLTVMGLHEIATITPRRR